MSAAAAGPGTLGDRRERLDDISANYRYGVVLVLVSIAVVFLIIAQDGNGARAVAFAIAAAALLVAISTARERTVVLRRRAAVGSVVTILLTALVAAGLIPRDVVPALTALVFAAVPVFLAGGLVRLVRARGATIQAVAGALAIYLLIGLVFASLIGFLARIGGGQYFAQSTNGTESDFVYYSFTALTTTGFGDLTAAHHLGRAVAVIEMLVGQLYLVTVIGVLVGRRVGQAH